MALSQAVSMPLSHLTLQSSIKLSASSTLPTALSIPQVHILPTHSSTPQLTNLSTLWLRSFFASALTAILGIAIDRIIYLPLRKNNAPSLVFLIASFGIFIFIQNLLQLLYGAQILTLRTGPVKEGYQFSVIRRRS